MSDQAVQAPRPATGLAATRRALGGRVVRYGFVAVAVGLGAYAVVRQWPAFQTALVDIGFWPSMGALAAVLAGLAFSVRLWRTLLASLGSPLPVRAAAKVFFVGQLGKYVPGSVWPVLAQMELGSVYRVPRERSATASVLTMLVSLLGGLLAALVTLPLLAGATAGYRWAFLAAPVLLACLHPRVLNPLLGRLLRLVRRPALERPLTGRTIAVALGWAMASWVLYGTQVWLLAVRLGAPEGRAVLLAVGGYAFAWCVGFLIVFAPAGAGVRELLLVALLAPVVGTAGATAVALVSRVVMTVGDLVMAGVAAVAGRRAERC
jgi:uncharacterized membrane protein YbhN (UPF0104 family)